MTESEKNTAVFVGPEAETVRVAQDLGASRLLEEASCPVFHMTISNRYYSADVHIFCMSFADVAGEAVIFSQADAVLFLESSLDGLWSNQVLKQGVSNCRAETRLCLIPGTVSTSQQHSEFEAIQDWMLDRFIELVHLEDEPDTSDPYPEKVGVERVLEALHSHMWTHMDRATEPARVPADGGDEGLLAGGQLSDAPPSLEQISPPETTANGHPVPHQDGAVLNESSDGASTGGEAPGGVSASQPDTPDLGREALQNLLGSDPNRDAEMDEFEQMLTMVNQVREFRRSNPGNLEESRARAEQVMLQLMTQMGDMDASDESD